MRRLVAAVAALAILGGCGSVDRAAQVLNNPHRKVSCTYERDGLDYKGTCSFEGSLPADGGGSPLEGLAAGAMPVP